MSSDLILRMMQMIKKNWIYGLFVLAVIFFIITQLSKKRKHPGEIQLAVKTFQTDLGWGYDILTNDSVFIHQEFIPAIEGRKGFATETDAKLIGGLAVSKMRNRKLPMITLSEIDSCKISR